MASTVAIIFFTAAAALAGAIVAALGGLVGRIPYRNTHPDVREELATQRAAATRLRSHSEEEDERAGNALVWVMVAAIVAVTVAPMGIAYLALGSFTTWEGLAASVGALVVGFGLLRLADNASAGTGYLYDFVGITLIVSGLIVATRRDHWRCDLAADGNCYICLHTTLLQPPYGRSQA